MNKELIKYITENYLNNCKAKNRALKESETTINYFFNRFNYFETYVNKCCNGKYNSTRSIPDVEYACSQSGLDYFYIAGLIGWWCKENNTHMFEN